MCCVCKQKTAYEMRISDWSSDVCSSDLFDDDLRAVRRHLDGIVEDVLQHRLEKVFAGQHEDVRLQAGVEDQAAAGEGVGVGRQHALDDAGQADALARRVEQLGGGLLQAPGIGHQVVEAVDRDLQHVERALAAHLLRS